MNVPRKAGGQQEGSGDGRLIFYHYWCWRVGGAVPVETSTGNNFLENAREFPEIITSTGATFWLRFCLSVLVLVIFKSPRGWECFRKGRVGVRGDFTMPSPLPVCNGILYLTSCIEFLHGRHALGLGFASGSLGGLACLWEHRLLVRFMNCTELP